MSNLHRDLLKRFEQYYLEFKSVELNKNHYLFNLIADDRVQITGTIIPIGTYDSQKNVLIWSDSSNTLDKNVVEEVRNLRQKLVHDGIDKASNDYFVITTKDIRDLSQRISELSKKEIILDNTSDDIHIYLVKKLLVDNRI